MEKGLVAIEINNVEAGIQAKSSDLAIADEFLRFPLTTNTKNWSFGKRKGLTTRYGIMPFPGHNSKDVDALPISPDVFTDAPSLHEALTPFVPANLYRAEDVLISTHPSFFTSYRNSYDVYQNRKSVIGAFIIPQPVQPSTNNKDYPVMYWATIRDRKRGALANAWQYDLVPNTIWRDNGGAAVQDGQEIVSNYAVTIGGGSAVIPPPGYSSTAYTGNAIENDVASFGKLTARALTADLFRLRNVSGVKWYSNFAEHTFSHGFALESFIGLAKVLSQAIAAQPQSLMFATYGLFPALYPNKGEQRSIACSVSTAKVGTLDYQKWQGSMNLVNSAELSNRAADVLVTYGFGNSSYVSYNIPSGQIDWNNTKPAWTIVKAGTAGLQYNYMHCEVKNFAVSMQSKIIASVVDGKPVIVMTNRLLADKTETTAAIDETSTPSNPTIKNNDYLIWASPSVNEYEPRQYKTKLTTDITLDYYENDDPADGAATRVYKNTCWIAAPKYIQGTVGTNLVTARGVLAKDKTYEYAYSIYNGITGVESNVGIPAKVYNDTDGNAIRVWPLYSAAFYPPLLEGTEFWAAAGAVEHQLPALTAAMRKSICNNVDVAGKTSYFQLALNMFSYRFYYREVGSYEWLYSSEATFADIYFKQCGKEILIGETNAIGLPGGQPGAYIDNSPLVTDQYLDVVSFAGKLWWLSANAVRFSSWNAFVYPIRNYISASSGTFLGSKVHYFAGQAEARGRLVIFGSKGMYDIRQTSEFIYTQVRVSATSEPQVVPIPDTNFSVAERGSHTAFSGRTAVVAEDALYFWGSTGIFRDDGVNLPQRVSDAIEPDLFDSYDNSKSEEFFSYYNKTSQEILFFYRPKTVTTELTKAWVYSVRTEDWTNGVVGAWSQYTYKCLIDWAQEIELTKFIGGTLDITLNGTTVAGSASAPPGAGSRTLIGARATSASTVSRPYFHDDKCNCGDMTPGTEMMVKSYSRINATTVRLTLASDYSATVLAAVLAGQTVYIFGANDYALETRLDGLRLVTGKGAGYIEIYDTSAIAGTNSVNYDRYFPVFCGSHAIDCNIDTNFFAPYGISRWSRYRYSHLLVQPVETSNGTVNATATVSWNCNHTLDTVTTKSIGLNALNSREKTTQIVFDMASPGMQSEGQGINLQVAYSQYGPRWTLFSWTLWTAPTEGLRNLLTYQQ